ncbi:MAG: nucleotidyl transferase AbiEii/AbiGii toxin family protein [Acidimicrobiia bacterium]
MSRNRPNPAGNVRGLQRWIGEWAAGSSESIARIQHRIALVAIAAMLDNACDAQGEPLFAVKGGSALELRYESAARASRDIDLAYRGVLSDVHTTLTACVESGWSGFHGRVLDPEPLTIPWANVSGQRISVKLTYLGKPFTTVPLEVVATNTVEVELVTSARLDAVGLKTPEAVPCLSLRYQIAEKLHACTDPLDGERINDRVSDLMDLTLIEDLSGDLNLVRVREACVDVFAHRATHPWPPVVTVKPTWPELWTNLVNDSDFYMADVNEVVARGNNLVGRINKAT